MFANDCNYPKIQAQYCSSLSCSDDQSNDLQSKHSDVHPWELARPDSLPQLQANPVGLPLNSHISLVNKIYSHVPSDKPELSCISQMIRKWPQQSTFIAKWLWLPRSSARYTLPISPQPNLLKSLKCDSPNAPSLIRIAWIPSHLQEYGHHKCLVPKYQVWDDILQ